MSDLPNRPTRTAAPEPEAENEAETAPKAAHQALSALSRLRRPRLLIRAARLGLADYNRSRDLKRLMNVVSAPAPAKALDGLLAAEAALEETRAKGQASYSATRHVELLIAMMAESMLLRARRDRTGPAG